MTTEQQQAYDKLIICGAAQMAYGIFVAWSVPAGSIDFPAWIENACLQSQYTTDYIKIMGEARATIIPQVDVALEDLMVAIL